MWNPMLNIVFPILVVGYQEISSVWYLVIMFQSINQLSYFSGGFLMCRISCWSSFIVEWRLANSWLRPWVEVCSILRASLWTKWRPVIKISLHGVKSFHYFVCGFSQRIFLFLFLYFYHPELNTLIMFYKKQSNRLHSDICFSKK